MHPRERSLTIKMVMAGITEGIIFGYAHRHKMRETVVRDITARQNIKVLAGTKS